MLSAAILFTFIVEQSSVNIKLRFSKIKGSFNHHTQFFFLSLRFINFRFFLLILFIELHLKAVVYCVY